MSEERALSPLGGMVGLTRKKQEWRRRLSLTALFACLIGLSLLVLNRRSDPTLQQLVQGEEGQQAEQGVDAAVGNQTAILVLGVDQGRGRADSSILAILDPDTQRIALVSIPRDTYVQIPGHGWDKLAHAYAFGGVPLARETVSLLLDIPINNYVSIDFAGFRQIVDALGGVDIEVEQSMHYDDPVEDLHIHFEPGSYHMDGKTALEYARYRSDSDLQRAQRQQDVIRAVLDKAVQPANVGRLPALIRSAFQATETDLSIAQALDLALDGRAVLEQGKISTAVFSTGKDEWMNPSDIAPDGIYYFIPDMIAFRTTAYQMLLGEEPTDTFLDRAREMQEQVNEAVQAQKQADAAKTSP